MSVFIDSKMLKNSIHLIDNMDYSYLFFKKLLTRLASIRLLSIPWNEFLSFVSFQVMKP